MQTSRSIQKKTLSKQKKPERKTKGNTDKKKNMQKHKTHAQFKAGELQRQRTGLAC